MNTNNDIQTLIVLVIGDSGVGKTSFVHTICHDQILSSPPPVTVGCHIEIKVYERKDRHLDRNLFFIEFHDIDGNPQHKTSRASTFYDEFQGIILVSDLTSRQSYDNLKEWLYEVIRSRSLQKLPSEFTSDVLQTFDIPILLVHTKLNESNATSLINNSKSTSISTHQSFSSSSLLPNFNRKSPLANLFNCDEIYINCYSNKKFSVDTPNVAKLNAFFEKMIKKVSITPIDQLSQFDWLNSENHYIQ